MDSDLDVMVNESLSLAKKLSSTTFNISIYELDIDEYRIRDSFRRCVSFKNSIPDTDILKLVVDLLLNITLKVMSTVYFGNKDNLVEENHYFNSLIYEIELQIDNLCLNTTIDINYELLLDIKDSIISTIESRLSHLCNNEKSYIKPISDFVYEDVLTDNVDDKIFYLVARNDSRIRLLSFKIKD